MPLISFKSDSFDSDSNACSTQQHVSNHEQEQDHEDALLIINEEDDKNKDDKENDGLINEDVDSNNNLKLSEEVDKIIQKVGHQDTNQTHQEINIHNDIQIDVQNNVVQQNDPQEIDIQEDNAQENEIQQADIHENEIQENIIQQNVEEAECMCDDSFGLINEGEVNQGVNQEICIQTGIVHIDLDAEDPNENANEEPIEITSKPQEVELQENQCKQDEDTEIECNDEDFGSKDQSEVDIQSNDGTEIEVQLSDGIEIDVQPKDDTEIDRNSKAETEIDVISKDDTEIDVHSKDGTETDILSKDDTEIDVLSKEYTEIDEAKCDDESTEMELVIDEDEVMEKSDENKNKQTNYSPELQIQEIDSSNYNINEDCHLSNDNDNQLIDQIGDGQEKDKFNKKTELNDIISLIDKKPNGFQLGWEPIEILGVDKTHDNKLLMAIKWKNGFRTLVPNYLANQFIPQMVIEFYEKRVFLGPEK